MKNELTFCFFFISGHFQSILPLSSTYLYYLKMSSTKISLLVIVFLTCNVALFVHGQVNAELDRPFVTRDGAVYRDELTIASSKSVAQFAKRYQRRENGKVDILTLYMKHLLEHLNIYAILYQLKFLFN